MGFFRTVVAIVLGMVLGAAILVGCQSIGAPSFQIRPFTAPPAQDNQPPPQPQSQPQAQAPSQPQPQAQSPAQGQAQSQPTSQPQSVAAQPPAQLQQVRESDAVVQVYERVSPGVVNITFVGRSLDQFGRPTRQEGTGSGFVIDKEGHIVTNQHVVANATRLDVTLADGTSYVGQLVVTDPATDLAVVKLQAPPEKLRDLTVVALGDSDALKVGQAVVAIGNPFGLERSASLGIVSSLGRSRPGVAERLITNMIQTDAAINPGNSGGPLLNLRGEVIGINEQIEAPARGNVGIGFAIPSNTLKRHLNTMLTGRTPEHAWIGIAGAPLTPTLAEQISSSVTQGILLTSVVPNGPAAKAGLRGATRNNMATADIMTELDGRPTRSIEDVAAYIDQKNPNDTVRVAYVRDGRAQTVDVALGVWETRDIPVR